MSKRKIGLGIFLLVLLLIGSTYAYWTWNSNTNKNIVFNTASGIKDYVIYDSGESKFVGDLTLDGSIYTTISINKNTNDYSMVATIYMDINSIDDDMKVSPALKWKVTSGDNTSFNSTPLAQGNFIGSNNGDTLTLVPNINVIYKGTNDNATKYTIWIYLDSSEYISSGLSGETLDTNVWTEINLAEGMEDVFEITRKSVDHQIIRATAVNNLYDITGYKVTTINTEPSSWDSASGRVFLIDYIADSGNRLYYIWVKDSQDRVISTTITTGELDNTGPSCVFDNAFSKASIRNGETATIKLTCTDTGTGIKSSNITLANLSLSSANMVLNSIGNKTAIENGYEYTLTVTGTSTDDNVTITLSDGIVTDQVNNGNSSVTSPAMAVANEITCASGYYLKANEYSCTICPAGSKCTGGTYHFFVNSDQGKTLCSPGTYQGSTGKSSCSSCSPGYYTNSNGATSCSYCTAGTYASGYGNTSCSNCNPGYYSANYASSCTACAKGTYAANSRSSSCTVCGAGLTTSSTGSTSSSACTACTNTGVGNVSTWATPSWSANTVTNLCTISSCNGGYEVTGSSSSTACSACAAGKYSSSGKSCVNCPIGSYSGSTASSCTACAGGTTNEATGSTNCPLSCDNNLGVATWVTPTFASNYQSLISKTSNVGNDGTTSTQYSSSQNVKDLITIPGASSLNVTITYQTEACCDWVCVYEGDSSNTSKCTTANSVSGPLANATRTTTTFEISGDTATFFFHSDGSVQNYGYYAIVEGGIDAVENTCSINSCNTGFTLGDNVCEGESTASAPTVVAKYVSDDSSYTSGTWTNHAIYVTLSSVATDTSITDFQYSTNGGTRWTNMSCSVTQSGTTYSCSYTWPLANDTNDTILFRGIDTLGKATQNSSSLNIKYDTEAPTGSISKSVSSGTINATLEAEDPVSGIGNYYYKLLDSNTCGVGTDGTSNFHTPSSMSNYDFTLNYSTDGTYYICVKVYDNANNLSYISQKVNTFLYEDPSGANVPVLTDGLIPVMISNNGATVTVARDTDKWYDYGHSLWANAVLVKNTGVKTREQNSVEGTVIDLSDIIAYYVWIPRYSYIIQTTGVSSAGNEQAFNITFVDTNTKHTGSTQGTAFTHPAFTFDIDGDNVANDPDDELAGIWVGKFELSHTSLTTSSMSCSSTSCTNADNLRILPNVAPLCSNTVSSFFFGIRSMQRTTTTFGLSTDSTVVDSHMMKNREWGAVAYLSHSSYGIGKNEVRVNSYYASSNMKTGCGASAANKTSETTCYDPYGKTTTGSPSTTGDTTTYPQSTTGNITGVFDMSGGSYEYVMGNYNNTTGSSGFVSSWFTTTGNSKYYDKYTVTSNSSCTFTECGGHALKETADWYSDHVYFVTSGGPWFLRGGYSSYGTVASIFYSDNNGGFVHGNNSARVVLVVA